LIRNLIMTAVFIVSSFTAILIHMKNHRNRHYFAEYHSDISMKERLIFSFKSFPFAAVAFVCLIAAIIKIAY
ncbi:MAG: CPBP family intramembrane metalloprotease, partial [Ruminococcus sp.]|nr:CPBP family intramembrane metalloprotease [Ruminococcus sp.]